LQKDLFLTVSTYALIIICQRFKHLQVGALGEVLLAPGWYLYAGSAKRNLEARLRRHLRPEKRPRWHIDYLLTGAACEIREIWAGEQAECRLAASLLTLPEITIPKPRLGASDCRCPAHFYRYDGDLATLQQHLLILGFLLYSHCQK
jgi:Uri superfamily endonuclease